ncbi:MAG: sulfotransferase [Phycisphaerales bacterium]
MTSEFDAFLQEEGGNRFCEKTPSNMVRLPFIRAVMPDCRVIHIIRDGRASTFSTLEVLGRPAMVRMIKRRVVHTPWWHYPAYIPKAQSLLSALCYD